ncbi:hypothetical protein D3C80_2098900 [compost metagenome]
MIEAKIAKVLAGADFPTINAKKFKTKKTKKKLIWSNVRLTMLKISKNTAAAVKTI